MRLTKERRYKILQLFGDNKEHNWFEVIFLGVKYLQIHQRSFEDLLRQCIVDNSLIKRVGRAPFYKDDYFQLTYKGDRCLRGEQLERTGEYDYYEYFDRSLEGSRGLDRFAPLPKNLQKIESNEEKIS